MKAFSRPFSAFLVSTSTTFISPGVVDALSRLLYFNIFLFVCVHVYTPDLTFFRILFSNYAPLARANRIWALLENSFFFNSIVTCSHFCASTKYLVFFSALPFRRLITDSDIKAKRNINMKSWILGWKNKKILLSSLFSTF